MGSVITKRWIADGAIDDSKIQAGANIATSKLADGANFLKKDGTVVMTGDFNAGGQKVVNVGTATNNTDAVNLAQMNAALANLNSLFKAKPSARAATTGNINLSNPGTAVFDGVTLSNGQVLYVRAQTAPQQNGLYTFNGSGVALTRIAEMDNWNEIPGAFFAVEEGTTYADTIWLCTANQGGTLGTTAITFQQIPNSAGLQNSNFVDKEVPSGAIDGVNVTFTLANAPVSNSSVYVWCGPLLLDEGAGADYTISGNVITTTFAPSSANEKIRVSYRK